MTDRHQGHSALPYQPAPSYFIHKNRGLWQFWTGVLFWFFGGFFVCFLFFCFLLPSWAPDRFWAPVQLHLLHRRYLDHWTEVSSRQWGTLVARHLGWTVLRTSFPFVAQDTLDEGGSDCSSRCFPSALEQCTSCSWILQSQASHQVCNFLFGNSLGAHGII